MISKKMHVFSDLRPSYLSLGTEGGHALHVDGLKLSSNLTDNFEIIRTFINIKYKFEHITYITQIIEKKYYLFFSFGCNLKQGTTREGKKKMKGGIHGQKGWELGLVIRESCE
jgi:hypothetical protein